MAGAPYAKELEVVLELAREASEVARRRAGSVRPEEKANQSYVTDLDRDLEQLIRGRLAERFPTDRITGEEYGDAGGSGPRAWSIDPIDGTGNMVFGLPLWSIAIGMVEDGEPALGVIAVPPLGEVFWATRGGGAWKDGEPIACYPDADAFHPQDNVCVSTNALRALDPRTIPGRLRDLGSACIESAFTAAGRLVACTYLGEQRHDVTAGAVIAAEAGCHFGTLDGRHLSPAQFVAATPVPVPTFVAPPRRLEALMRDVKRLP